MYEHAHVQSLVLHMCMLYLFSTTTHASCIFHTRSPALLLLLLFLFICFRATFSSFESGISRASHGSLSKKVGGVVVCRHGETHGDAAAAAAAACAVTTADCAEAHGQDHRGPPFYCRHAGVFFFFSVFLTFNPEIKQIFSGIIMRPRVALTVRDV